MTTSWIPHGLDRTTPSAARAYDYLLGGTHHFGPDRELAEQVLTVLPARQMARENRRYLHRVLDFLQDSGIDQFLDLGSGLPVMESVHEVAHRRDSVARVVYVDNDPSAVAHSDLILRDVPLAVPLCRDVRDPVGVLQDEATQALLDFTRPVALLMLGVTQFLHDEDDPQGLIATYRDALASGSYLALSSFTSDNDPEAMDRTIEMFEQSGRSPIVPRSRTEVLGFLGDFEIVEPGLVYTTQWRRDGEADPADPAAANLWAGVARKP